ncbi:MAG TPA: DNA topoisomerase IB [Planctomycetota bacterium]|nr:DNA topoisomerase IB [Planctomycetota bacterium]
MSARKPVTPPPVAAARGAGLRYVGADDPGLTRRRTGRGFAYVTASGRRVRGPATLARIRSLAIPPAWTGVWICPEARGHIQATGRDARGRKQYRYHPAWQEVRREDKFGRMLAFSAALPAIRRRIAADLARPGLDRHKVLATVVRLLECTQIRVGNDEYARTNGSYGLTTLRHRHVAIRGPVLHFEFKGKSGQHTRVGLADRRLARIVRRCQSLPGEHLFQYLDDDGRRQSVGSGDVNDYIRAIAGDGFSAKDFRTWAGTVLACEALLELGAARTRKAASANVVRAIDRVAQQLRNTRAVCRAYYIHPAVLAAYEQGTLESALRGVKPPPARHASDRPAARRPSLSLTRLEAKVVRLLAGRGSRDQHRGAGRGRGPRRGERRGGRGPRRAATRGAPVTAGAPRRLPRGARASPQRAGDGTGLRASPRTAGRSAHARPRGGA